MLETGKKIRPFSYNVLWLFENGRKQTINNLVVTLLENGRNFGRFPTTSIDCLKAAENLPSTILWGLCWKTAEISAVFQQLGFGRFPTTQNVSVVFQQTGFGRFPTTFFGRFPHPQRIHCMAVAIIHALSMVFRLSRDIFAHFVHFLHIVRV